MVLFKAVVCNHISIVMLCQAMDAIGRYARQDPEIRANARSEDYMAKLCSAEQRARLCRS